MSDASKDFTHPQLDEEVTAIGGHYVPVKEVLLPFQDRRVLYIAGYAAVDTSCCATGGCGYAKVPGYILDWKCKTGKENRPVSSVEPIRDRAARKQIRQLIEKAEGIRQSMVDFD